MEPLQVIFTIAEGDVWIDPDKNAWCVRATTGDTIHLERRIATEVSPYDLVRTWRKAGGTREATA